MYIPENKKPKDFKVFVNPLFEIRRSIHELGQQTVESGDGSYIKLFSRTMEAALNGGLRKGDFVFNYQAEKRQRVFMTMLRKETKSHQRTPEEGAVMQLVHEIIVICEEAERAVLDWLPEQIACWNLLQILAREFAKGIEGAFFSTTTRVSNLFEAAKNSLERSIPVQGRRELMLN